MRRVSVKRDTRQRVSARHKAQGQGFSGCSHKPPTHFDLATCVLFFIVFYTVSAQDGRRGCYGRNGDQRLWQEAEAASTRSKAVREEQKG